MDEEVKVWCTGGDGGPNKRVESHIIYIGRRIRFWRYFVVPKDPFSVLGPKIYVPFHLTHNNSGPKNINIVVVVVLLLQKY